MKIWYVIKEKRINDMKKRNVDMLSGPITKGLISLTMPIMIMYIVSTLFNIVDMAVLRIFSSDRAVGAVGATGTLTTLCTSLLIGVSVGANVVVAKRIGLGDKERVSKAVHTALAFSVVGGIFLMFFGSAFAETFLKMTNCPESLLTKATIYFKIFFYGYPFSMVYTFCAAILRAVGDTKRPMYFIILGAIIKLIFTVLFVTTTNMDVEGVAIATIICNIVISALAFNTLRKNDKIHVDIKKIRFHASEFKEMLFIGIPSGLQTAMYSFANVVITATVNRFGADATTGLSIANQFDGLMYYIIYAPAVAATPYVAQNIGARNHDRVKKSILSSILITTSFGLVFGSLSAIFSAELSSIMSSSPEVIKYSQQKMVLVSSTYFLSGINEILGGVLKGMGKPIIPAVSTMVFMCLIRFPWVYFVFPLFPQNLTFLYLIWPIGWILSIITLLSVFIPAISKLQTKLSKDISLTEAVV